MSRGSRVHRKHALLQRLGAPLAGTRETSAAAALSPAQQQVCRGDLKRLRRASEAVLARLDLPDGCSIATLMERLSADRGRPIQLVELPLGAKSPCGMWLATDEADIIVVEANTSRLHRDHIIAHELAHMLCGHRDSTGPDPTGLGHLLPSLDPRRVREILGRTSYSSTEEQEAETVASLILEQVTRPPVEPRWDVPPVDAETVARIDHSLNPGNPGKSG
ncbi:ImmA/IrrE family metallo-endopeptidase [Streptomyces sp. ET3-23]|uniref:ImmA/IrrE family metallo-endopeptidase n=1 Tax=Streptomyces sp. ET3-23 TaxID=2885643 RepID=UPI001D102593|nr:ImmA/IrrE family metallo-endopeptidase [Streptomyces sp. ET3-23]MCC2279947.1 ImmA/IrrE family metallo-endopeptidase [Streptomyces sp. ET3-23]